MRERTVTRKTLDLNRLTDDPTWPTKRQDVLAALTIMQQHASHTGGSLRLLEGWSETDHGSLWVQLPAWLLALG